MLNNSKLSKYLYVIELIIAFISSIITIIEMDLLFFFIPFIYLILKIISYKIFIKPAYDYKIGHYSIRILMLIKYAIMPIMFFLFGNKMKGIIIPSQDALNMAYILIIYELVAIYFVFYYLTAKKQKKINYTKQISFSKNINIYILFILLSLILLFVFPEFFIPKNFLILKEIYNKPDFNMSGFISIIAYCFKIILLFVILRALKKLYDKEKKKRYILFSGLSCLIYIGLNTGTGRWIILFSTVLSIFILFEIYGKKVKTIVFFMTIIMFISITSITVTRTIEAGYITSSNVILESLTNMLRQFDTYFSGPITVSQSLEILKEHKNDINIVTFFNDFLGSVPLLSNFIDQTNRINYFYNYYSGVMVNHPDATPLIMPMISIGYAYFGYLFSPIFFVFFIAIAVIFDKKISKESIIDKKFLYSYSAIMCSLCIGFNTQIIYGYFISKFLPLFILIWLNNNVGGFKNVV